MATASTMVTSVLMSYETLCIKPFSVNGTYFDPVDLQKIGQKIQAGYYPAVKYNSKLTHSYYHSSNNELWFKFFSAPSVMERSMVIHEATHAVCDMNSAKMTIAESEAMAYIVQSQFAYANNPYPKQRYLQGGTWQSDRVFQIAWTLAKKLIESGQTITASEVSTLKNAIAGNPTYAASAANSAGYNGL